MHRETGGALRTLRSVELSADLVVVGGGMAGVCAAIAAAREGARIVLMQDRPVLGGNASSEIRLWMLGATAHMESNNRWAREGGVINEIMVENLYRNREGNPVIVDTVILDKVLSEPNITLLLNTAAFDVEKVAGDPDRIAAVRGFCSQNATLYTCRAPLFCDASGDGVVGFLAGAAFRMGAEPREEFDEAFAPSGEYGGLLGHSIYFYTRDTGRPVTFVPPSYALKNVPERIPRYKSFNTKSQGCRLWWIEHGGRLDTVHDTEAIKWELWRIVYGVWDYIKNSGKFPDAATLTLDWVGTIPGKRESRRFEGDYMLRQQDVITRRLQADAVAHGGWSIDLHPADGVFAKTAGAHQLQGKGIYGIPYRCYYSRNIHNLFLAGRIISASHVAFGSTRVMCTCAAGGQAVGVAAAICAAKGLLPRALAEGEAFEQFRRRLQRTGQHIIGVPLDDPDDRAGAARLSATSDWRIGDFPADHAPVALVENGMAQLLPLGAGPAPVVTFWADVAEPTTVRVRLATSSDAHHHTPDVTLGEADVALPAGRAVPVRLAFAVALKSPGYGFFIVEPNPLVALHRSTLRATGVLALTGRRGGESDYTAIGGERVEWWRARRRPEGQNLAFTCEPPLRAFEPAQVKSGFLRPTHQSNAWVAAPDDPAPALTLAWPQPQRVARIEVWFDPDYDHPMESVLWGHPESVVPFCVRDFSIADADGRELARVADNHETRCVVMLAAPVRTAGLTIRVHATHGAPAAIVDVQCYG